MWLSHIYIGVLLWIKLFKFQFLNWKQRTVSRETCRQFSTGFLHTESSSISSHFPFSKYWHKLWNETPQFLTNAAHLASAWQKLPFISIFFVGIYPNLAPFLSGELNCTRTVMFWHAYDFEFTVKFGTILYEIYKNNLHGSRRKRRRAKIMRSTYKKTMTQKKLCQIVKTSFQTYMTW